MRTTIEGLLYRAANPVRALAWRVKRSPAAYSRVAPSAQAALDIFKGEWIGALPPPFQACVSGALPLFNDPGLAWGIDQAGGVADQHVLELGPLEGSHTWLLQRQGAASITSVEAHPRAYLRCLVVKEILGLTKARFLHGDFVAFLREPSSKPFDLAVASGVLYHLEDPVELLARLSNVCSTMYVWTHYFDASHLRDRPAIASRFSRPRRRTSMGFEHVVHPFEYGPDRMRRLFCGGPRQRASWLDRRDILAAIAHFGFRIVAIGREEPDHIHGPAFAFVARKV